MTAVEIGNSTCFKLPFDDVITIMSHNRGDNNNLKLNPHIILEIRNKFEVPSSDTLKEDFRVAYRIFFMGGGIHISAASRGSGGMLPQKMFCILR